tara:strand:+ start:1093 stop:1359 length:267 start_codon:yes stop_codon:yes gene_type:complete
MTKLKGSLFVNQGKTNDRQPDYTGVCDQEGSNEKLQIAAWKKESANGVRYLSFTIQPKYQKEKQTTTPMQKKAIDAFDMEKVDDGLPF